MVTATVPKKQVKVDNNFVAKTVERARTHTVGAPFNSNTQQRPQVDQDQFSKVISYKR
jgi:aldehyde dehydrogenase (NAD+)